MPDKAPSTIAGLAALALAGCALLPFEPDTGDSVVSLILTAFAEDWLNGVFALLLFGMPYLFGLTAAIAIFAGGRGFATAVKVPLVILQAEIFILALVVWHEKPGVAPGAMAGFGVVSAIYLIVRSAAVRTAGRRTSIAFLVRWGGVLIAGVFGWLRLQGEGFTTGMTATMLCAAALAVLSRARRQPNADE